MSSLLRVLMLGDIVGNSGSRALYAGLSTLTKKHRSDLVIVNAENASDGFGLTPEIADRLFASGVSVITTGNHIWQRREILEYMTANPAVLRPANYPGDPPAAGWCSVEARGVKVIVANILGRTRLSNVDCPFIWAQRFLKKTNLQTAVVVVDFHAEDTEEKESMGFFLDGQVSVVAGTHTHVQTADERILPKGTAYITDLGMTGPLDSVIGFDPAVAIDRMKTQMPLKMVVSDRPAAIRGAFIEIDVDDGHATSIERVDYNPGI